MGHWAWRRRCSKSSIPVDVDIDDEDKAFLLIGSLNKTYEPVGKTLLYSNDSIDLDDVVASLIYEEIMNKDPKENKGGDNLYVDSGQGNKGKNFQKENRSKGKKPDEKSKVICYYCKKEGHFKKDCNKRKADREKKVGKKIEVGVADSGADDGDLLHNCVGMNNSDDAWLLDSGCSFHMCPNKEWLQDYQAFDGGSVLMGNNVSCKMLGFDL